MNDMDPRAPGHDPSSRDALWAIRWSDGRLTVLTARHPDHVQRIVAFRRGATRDGWPAGDHVWVLGVVPVDYLELSVAPRQQLNQPKYGFVRIGDAELSWSGPRSGLPPRGGGIDLVASTSPDRVRCVPGSLWSYVWTPTELVLFTALDFGTARAWAARSVYGAKGEVDPECIEPVEKLELHLARDENGFAPTCYRVWVEGLKVGWPPTEVQSPDPSGSTPKAPLGAEIRLPIPTYFRTHAYASCGRGAFRGLDRSAGEVRVSETPVAE